MARKRKCKWFGTYTEDYIVTPVAAFCGMDCAIEYANKAKNKAMEKQLAKARNYKHVRLKRLIRLTGAKGSAKTKIKTLG